MLNRYRSYRAIALPGLLSLLFSLPTFGQEALTINPLGRIYHGFGTVSQFIIEDTLAYIATGQGGVQVWSIREIDNPTFLGVFDDTKHPVVDLEKRDSILFVLCSSGSNPADGFEIISLDVTDPFNPGKVGEWAEFAAQAYNAKEIIIRGNRAYVNGKPNMLCSVNITDPANMALSCSYDNSFSDIAVSDEYLYGTETGPWLTAIQIGVDNELIRDPYHVLRPASVGYVEIDGNRLYSSDNQGVTLYEIDDALNPERRGNWVRRSLIKIYPAGDRIYTTGDNINYFDVSDPDTFLELTHIGVMNIADVHLSENGPIVLHIGPNAIGQVDFSDLQDPYYSSYHSFDYLSYNLTNVYHVGNKAYVSDGSVLRILDVSDPTHPQEQGIYVAAGTIGDMVGNEDFLYLALSGQQGRGLRVLDVSDPENPAAIAYDNFAGNSNRLFLRDTLLYVARSDSGLQIYNVADSYSPVRVVHYPPDTRSDFTNMVIEGDLIYRPRGEAIDVFRFNSPLEIDSVMSFDIRGAINVFTVKDSIAYIRTNSLENIIVDLRNLESPDIKSTFNPPGVSKAFFAEDSILYVADGKYGGLRLYSVADLDNPRLLCNIDTPGDASDLAVNGNIVYVVGVTNFSIYSIDEASVVEHSPLSAPMAYRLLSAYPNPFNGTVKIEFTLQKPGMSTLGIFDLAGRQLDYAFSPEFRSAGNYSVSWDASRYSAGVYYVRLETETKQQTEQILLVK